MVSKKVLAGAAVAALLASRRGRGRAVPLPGPAQRALQRRRAGLPRGVEELPPVLVDRRHAPVTARPAAAADDPAAIVAEHYDERRAGH